MAEDVIEDELFNIWRLKKNFSVYSLHQLRLFLKELGYDVRFRAGTRRELCDRLTEHCMRRKNEKFKDVIKIIRTSNRNRHALEEATSAVQKTEKDFKICHTHKWIDEAVADGNWKWKSHSQSLTVKKRRRDDQYNDNVKKLYFNNRSAFVSPENLQNSTGFFKELQFAGIEKRRCQWSTLRKEVKYKCTNEALEKETTCSYHVEKCLKNHADENNKIQIPNHLSLCLGHYFVETGIDLYLDQFADETCRMKLFKPGKLALKVKGVYRVRPKLEFPADDSYSSEYYDYDTVSEDEDLTINEEEGFLNKILFATITGATKADKIWKKCVNRINDWRRNSKKLKDARIRLIGNKCANMIQACFRGYVIRMKYRKLVQHLTELRKHYLAKVVQAVVRGVVTRKKIRKYRFCVHFIAIKLQRSFRRRQKMKAQQKLNVVLRLQRIVRKCNIRDEIHRWKQQEELVFAKISSRWMLLSTKFLMKNLQDKIIRKKEHTLSKQMLFVVIKFLILINRRRLRKIFKAEKQFTKVLKRRGFRSLVENRNSLISQKVGLCLNKVIQTIRSTLAAEIIQRFVRSVLEKKLMLKSKRLKALLVKQYTIAKVMKGDLTRTRCYRDKDSTRFVPSKANLAAIFERERFTKLTLRNRGRSRRFRSRKD